MSIGKLIKKLKPFTTQNLTKFDQKLFYSFFVKEKMNHELMK